MGLHVVLEHGSPDHGEGAEDETSSDLLDGTKVDVTLTQGGVDERIHDCGMLAMPSEG